MASPDAVITSSPEPCTVTTYVGATVALVLDPGFNWGTPKSNSSTVEVINVRRRSSGALDADLRALRVGRATVSAVGSMRCPPGQPCPALARLWAVHITVRAVPFPTITVTQADNEHRYQLHLGDRLDVQLSGTSIYTWTAPVSSDQTVLQRTVGLSGTRARGAFFAAARGNAKISAIENPTCYPQCLAPSRLFEVTVSVSG